MHLNITLTSPKLADRFNKELNQSYSALAKNPFFELKYKDYRALPLKKFPFILLFVVDEDHKIVSIYSVFHSKQNPKKLPNYK